MPAGSRRYDGKLGVSLHHLRTGERLQLHADELFPTGSTIKVALLCAAMEQVEKGELQYYQRFELTADTRFHVPWPMSGAAGELDDYRKWGVGVSTPNAMRLLLELIASGKAGTPAACDEMHRILNHQYFDDGIAGQVPPTTVVASKSGVEKHSRSDLAIVHAPSGTYVLAIYTKDRSIRASPETTSRTPRSGP
jgi:beta-lactamase class A